MERKIQATGSVEVYQTESGQICLKQEADISGEDNFVIFPTIHADKIVQWILEVKKEIEELEAD